MNEMKIPIAYEEKENPELEQDFVFISYCHADKDVVYSDLSRMNEYGARFWYDENVYAGDNWISRVTNIINSEHCRGVLFYLSPNSFYSLPMLTEVKLSLEKLKQNGDTNSKFKICSINMGRKPVLETLRTLNVSEELFRGFLFAFDENVRFIARYFDPKSDDHLEEMIDFFRDRNSLPDEYAVIDYYDGVQIIKYNGVNNNIIIPPSIRGKKVNAIGIHAFEGNKNIRTVHISEGPSIIDDFAFSHCDNLEKIVLPSSLKIIGYESFCKCYNLKEITFPYNVSKIGSHAFYKCTSLEKLTINAIVPYKIRFAAFEDCESLSEINFSNALEEIEPYAFSNCVSLKYVLIPDFVRKIGNSAFNNCSSLEEVHFKPDLAPDNENIFSRCISLKSITIDEEDKETYNNNKTWEEYHDIFKYKLRKPGNIVYNNTQLFWDGSKLAENYIIRVNGKESVVSGKCVYNFPDDNESILKVVIKAVTNEPDCINSDYSDELMIDKNAFKIISEGGELVLKNYIGMEENIIIPSDITIIGDGAFYNNTRIKSVVFPKNLRIIGQNAFYRCRNLESVKFPHSLEEIGDYAFWGTKISKRLILPTSLKRIGIRAFAGSGYITSVTIGSPDINMGRGVFYRCLKIKSVNLPKNFHELSQNLFKGCFELQNLVLPEGLIKISEGSLSSIMKIKEITIPENVSIIERDSFLGSFSLEAIHVNPNNTIYKDIEGVLINNLENTLCVFPPNHREINSSNFDGIEIIGYHAFSDNALINKVILPNSIKEINDYAFDHCTSLKEIVIGDDIQKIGSKAFNKCLNLRSITIRARSIPRISHDSFANTPESLRIYVPEDEYSSYLLDNSWNEIKAKILKIGC